MRAVKKKTGMRDICKKKREKNYPIASCVLTTIQASISLIDGFGADDGLYVGIKTRKVRCGNGQNSIRRVRLGNILGRQFSRRGIIQGCPMTCIYFTRIFDVVQWRFLLVAPSFPRYRRPRKSWPLAPEPQYLGDSNTDLFHLLI